jgi:hypothetical protein
MACIPCSSKYDGRVFIEWRQYAWSSRPLQFDLLFRRHRITKRVGFGDNKAKSGEDSAITSHGLKDVQSVWT